MYEPPNPIIYVAKACTYLVAGPVQTIVHVLHRDQRFGLNRSGRWLFAESKHADSAMQAWRYYSAGIIWKLAR